MNELIEKLKPCDSNLFKIATVPSLDEESAKKLVNKHIHFTWHNKKDKTVLTIPGLVLDYKDSKLKVFTNDILFEDNSIDEEHNKFIELIPITDIENYMVFDNYTENCWELSENIDFDDDGIVPKIYKISNIFGETVECVINDIDTLNISFTYKISNGDIVTISDYPSYFIKNIMAEEKEYAISLRMDYNVFSFDKFKKEYDDKNGTIKWFFLDNRDIKVGDIVYIYCSNMPDLVNRFIIRAKVCEVVKISDNKDVFNKVISEYINKYALEKNNYKSYITLTDIKYLDSKDIYDFSTDRLKNKYKKEYGGFQGRSGKITNNELLKDLKHTTCANIQEFLDKWVDSDCFFHDIKLKIDSVVDQDRYNIHPVFVKDNGIKYVEYHHLIFRNKSYGIDSNSRIHELINKEYNYLRLCPSCHRMIHYGSSSIRKQMIDAICKKHVPNNREGLEEILKCLKINKSVEDYLYEIYDINK